MALTDDEIVFIAAVERASTVADVQRCIEAYYEDFDNPTGGSLHIVLDDFNYADDHVRYCVESAEADGPLRGDGHPSDDTGPPDPLGAALGRKLLSMSVEDRAAANYPQLCSTCQHSLSLHRKPLNEYAGLSCQGACMIDGCPCENA